MQHAQLVNGIKRVTEALEHSGLREALSPQHADDTAVLLESLRKYAISAASYTSAEETVADLLGLTELDSSTAWSKLLSGGAARLHYFDRVGFVTHHLPRFVELLEESSVMPPSSERSLCVTVIDAERGLDAPRLVTILNSVGNLYKACADLRGKAVEDLRLVSYDGGEDTLLWFEGDLEAVGWCKQLLSAAFRWLALYRERDKLQERITLAKDNLPTIQMIRQLVERGSLNADEASAIEHKVLVGLLAFFDAGAIIPEMERDLQTSIRDMVSSRPPGVAPELAAVMQEIRDIEDGVEDIQDIDDDAVSLVGDEEGAEYPDDDGEIPTRKSKSDDERVGEEAIIDLEPGAVEISD